MNVDVDELLGIALDVAGKAGDLLLHRRQAGVIESGTKSSPTDLVTVMDTESESLIRELLRSVRPHDAVLGEEGGVQAGDSLVRWVVDPLDGTVNYRYGVPHWSVSIAAEADGETLVGVVFDPAYGETWVAVSGRGATCNGEPVTASAETRLEQSLVATGFSYEATVRTEQAEVLRHVLPRVRDIRRFGSCAVDLCWTAAGRYDAYYERGTQVWDWTAGALIAREAGVRVEGLHGAAPSPALIVAAPPALFGSLHDLLVAGGAGAA